MHRSGTSVVAGLLSRHGLWLGADEALMQNDAYNPDGYYEHLGLVEVNDAILAAFGGTWDAPPVLPAGFEAQDRLAPLRHRAAEIMAELSQRPWGFKDPRACLTIPFWRALQNDLRFVVCLRNPLEVARSLARRDDISEDRALHLWFVHYGAILAATSAAERVVVDYDALCADPIEVAAALLAKVPAPLAKLDPEVVQSVVRRPLRHHRASAADLNQATLPAEILDIYRGLQAEVPSTSRRRFRLGGSKSQQNADQAVDFDETLAAMDLELRDTQVELRKLAATVAGLEADLARNRQAGAAALVSPESRHDSGARGTNGISAGNTALDTGPKLDAGSRRGSAPVLVASEPVDTAAG